MCSHEDITQIALLIPGMDLKWTLPARSRISLLLLMEPEVGLMMLRRFDDCF